MTGLKGKNQTEINEIAKQAWENEMQKRRDYFLKYNINVFTYTDSNLHYIDTVWEDISRFLTPKMINRQNMFYIFNKTLI